MFEGVSGGGSDPEKVALLNKVRQQHRTGMDNGPVSSYQQNMSMNALQHLKGVNYGTGNKSGGGVSSQLVGGGGVSGVVGGGISPAYLESIQGSVLGASGIPKLQQDVETIMEQREQEWYQLRYNGMDKDQVDADERERLLKNNDYFERENINYEFSKKVIKAHMSPFIPYHAVRIHDTVLYVECAAPLAQQREKDTPLPIWKPQVPINAFGSVTAYAQGTIVPIANQKTGRLANTFIIQINIKGLKSYFPVAMGLRFGDVTDKNTFTPYNGTKFYTNDAHDQNTNHEDSGCYHLIIPPYGQIDEIQVYRSTSDINNPYGRQYTSLTEKEEDITEGVHEAGKSDKFRVPYFSPLLEWIFCESRHLYPPQKSKDHEKHFLVPAAQYWAAVHAIKEKVSICIPVRNLETFGLQLYPLQKLSASKNFHQKIIQEGGGGVTTTNNNGGGVGSSFRTGGGGDTYGIHFYVDMKIMFRDYSPESQSQIHGGGVELPDGDELDDLIGGID
jgi:hypothetical protein